MSPKYEAYAFRIWQFCEPLGWNANLNEIASATGISPCIVGRVIKAKGWATRVRVDGASAVNMNNWLNGPSIRRWDNRVAEVASQVRAEVENYQCTRAADHD